jgi:hypothetical protein
MMNDLSCLITAPGGKGVLPWTWAGVGLVDSPGVEVFSPVLEHPASAKTRVKLIEQDMKWFLMASIQ